MALTAPKSEVLAINTSASDFLKQNGDVSKLSPSSWLYASDNQQLWRDYERALLVSLESGDEKAARQCLDRLSNRFGSTNERVMGFKGIFDEATAGSTSALKGVLDDYEKVVSSNPINASIAKRRVALLREMDQPDEAIKALNTLTEFSPTDLEAWTELSELYYSIGLYGQSIFCLEEVLLIAPNAWNIHTRLGEVMLVAADTEPTSNAPGKATYLGSAVQRFCRSLELCEGYIRGSCGLKLATTKLRELLREDRSVSKLLPFHQDLLADIETRTTAVLEAAVHHAAQGANKSDIAAARHALGLST